MWLLHYSSHHQHQHWCNCDLDNSQVYIISYIIFLHVLTHELNWDELRWDFSKPKYRDDIYYFMMYWIRYQNGFTALQRAATGGHYDITKLLIDGGAEVNSKNKVSNMIWEVVMTVCAITFVIMTGDSSIIVLSSTSVSVPEVSITMWRINLTSL